MAKITIGKAPTPDTLAEQVEEAGFGFGRNDNGETTLTVKFPGVDSMEITRSDLGRIVDTLDRPTPTGDSPGAVFSRTATEEPDGSMSAKFSDAKRSRSVSFSPADRVEVAKLLEGHLANWSEYESRLAQAEAEANDDAE